MAAFKASPAPAQTGRPPNPLTLDLLATGGVFITEPDEATINTLRKSTYIRRHGKRVRTQSRDDGIFVWVEDK